MPQEQAQSPLSGQNSAQNPPTPSSAKPSPEDQDANHKPNSLVNPETAPTENTNATETKEPPILGANPAAAELTNLSPWTNLSRHSITSEMVFGPIPDREYHEGFMRKAIGMAQLALDSDETPVGCVFVRDGEVIGRGINGTNASLNVSTKTFFFPFMDLWEDEVVGLEFGLG